MFTIKNQKFGIFCKTYWIFHKKYVILRIDF